MKQMIFRGQRVLLFRPTGSASPSDDQLPLYFESGDLDAQVKFVVYHNDGSDTNIAYTNTDDELDCELQYSINNQETWIDVDSTTEIHLLAGGNRVYFKAKTINDSFYTSNTKYGHRFVLTGGNIRAGGNIQYLLSSTGETNTVQVNCFRGLFSECSTLISAPKLLATNLSNFCYHSMFFNCIALTSAPALPATALAANCYNRMFLGCSSLTKAPALPATALVTNCYSNMFNGCSNLSSVTVSFNSWNNGAGTTSWLSGVNSSGTFTCPNNLDTTTRGKDYIPTNWTIIQ